MDLYMGLRRMLEVPGVSHLDLDLGMVSGLCCTHVPRFSSPSSFWRCKEHPCPASPHLGLWILLKVTDWGVPSWTWFEYGHWPLIPLSSNSFLSTLNLKVQRTSMSLKSWFEAFNDAGGSWLVLDILILSWIWSLFFSAPMFWIWALSVFWRCKEHPCPLSPDMGLWRTLEVPDWGLASWYWFGYGHWSLFHPYSEFWLSFLI